MSWLVNVEFRPSSIHGMGAFAGSRISAGTKVWTFDPGMQVCDKTDLMALGPDRLKFALHGGYLHHPSGKFVWYEDGMQYVNHADGVEANIGILSWTPLEEDHCTALRDIEPGEELFEDYSFWSICSLRRGHWLHSLYRRFCPDHYAFLNTLEATRQASLRRASAA